MDNTHLHLLINHVPILLTLFAIPVLAWGLFRSNKSYQHLAMVGFIIAGILSIAALQTGEGAEDLVETLPGVTEDYIHSHEEAAELTTWFAAALALMGAGGIFLAKHKPTVARTYLYLMLVAGMVSASMLAYTAYLGGHIRHTEIRPPDSTTQAGNQADQTGRTENRER